MTTSIIPAAETVKPGETVEQVDPSTLLLDRNIRSDAAPDKGLIDSVREVGVLQPIIAVTGPDGLRVRYGHRRTLVALETQQATVPVIIRTQDEDDATRIVEQWHENEFRAPITEADQVAAVEQLSLLGVSATQVAKRLQLKRGDVKTARSVAANETARAAMEALPTLTLDHAAVLAELAEAGQAEAVEVLLVTARDNPGQFEHAVANIRATMEAATRQQQLREQIAATGVTVLPGRPGRDDGVTELDMLRDSDGNTISTTQHATCPGHVAWLTSAWGYWTEAQLGSVHVADDGEVDPDDLDDEDYQDAEDYGDGETGGADSDDAPRTSYGTRPTAAYGCLEAAEHGHTVHERGSTASSTAAPASVAEQVKAKEEARAARREVVTNNREWRAAEEVRREWVKTYLNRKTPPKGTLAYLATELAWGRHAFTSAASEGHPLACEWLGVDKRAGYYNSPPTGLTALIETSTEARAQLVMITMVLASYEAATSVNDWRASATDWRNTGTTTKAYLLHLANLGYTLFPVEELAAGVTATSGD